MSLQTRALVACSGFCLAFTGLSWKLAEVSVGDNEKWKNKASSYDQNRTNLRSRRGSILDLNGEVLARNVPLKTVIADTSLLYELGEPGRDGTRPVKRDLRDKFSKILALQLGLKFAEVRAKMEPDAAGKVNRYIVVKKKISEDEAEKLERAFIEEKIADEITKAKGDEKKIAAANALREKQTLGEAGVQGITFEQEFKRIYPVGSLLAHVVGFYGYIPKYDKDGKELPEGRFGGVEGIERSMDHMLTGVDGYRYYQKDAAGREIVAYRGTERAPRNGYDVRLTIDLNIQQIVEQELDAACRELKPKRACVLMMDPNTGRIMAMANRPVYDPNSADDAKGEQKLNFAVSGAIEPGSTIKTVSAAGAMNTMLPSGKPARSIDDKIDCENGRWTYMGVTIGDHHRYGSLSVADIIAKSSNIGAVKLAMFDVKKDRIYGLLRDFGFGSRSGIALPHETKGILRPEAEWTPSSYMHIPFGHEVAASPLQMVLATSVIANGGNLMMPCIVEEIVDDTGASKSKYQPQIARAQLIKPSVAKDTGSALEKVTAKGGTATKARVPGFIVAGKTGTAQIFDHKLQKYSREDHIVSFVGYMPAEAPRFCMLVLIDDSATVNGNKDTGGTLAAPVFSRIAERTAAYLGLQPDPELYEEEMAYRKALAKGGDQ